MDFFSENKIKGVIFDCDGVLVDSELMSCSAINIIFEKYFQVDIGRDYSQIVGKKVADGFDYYIKTFNITVPPHISLPDLYIQKDKEYQNLARNKLQTFPGVVSLLDYLQTNKLKMIVASSGTKDKISFNLHESSLEKYFSLITSSEEVKNSKPAPDLFLLSAKKLHLEPKNCMVIEDSRNGIKAAKAAGMIALGVTNTFKKEDLLQAGADIIVTRIDELIQ